MAYFFLGDLGSRDFLKIPETDATTFLYVLIPMAAIFVGQLMYRQQLQKVDTKLPLEEKLATYQTALIIRWALIEGAAFLILFLKPELVALGLLLILYLILLRPSEDGMKRDFQAFGK
ncbi:MFS transporter [Flagellimonas taeanensis]|nr:MFS transporter [Allomuricauda taeanensis]RIV53902.1 MFS transporter [Allomuricauda taeanensis]